MERGKDFLTVKEVAQALGISEQGVRMKIYRRQIPARRWGRRVIILREDLERFMRSLPPAVPDDERGGR